MTSPSLTSSGAGRSRSPRASKSTTPPPPPPTPYPAAILPSGPKATLVTSPSLTSSGAGRSRSPRASKSTTPPPPPPTPYPAAILPSGPKATLVTPPSLTSSGAGRSRSPRASKSTTPPPRTPPTPISRGDLALRPEGHARDIALGDVEEANDFRTRVERALQAPPSFEGVSLLRGFQGQQHREVQPFRPHRIRQAPPADVIPRSWPEPSALPVRASIAPGFALGRCLGGDVGVMAGVVSPQRKPAGGGGEHTCDDGGDEEAAAESLLPLGRQPRRLPLASAPPLARPRRLHAGDARSPIHLARAAARPPRWRRGTPASIGVEFVAVRRDPLPAHGQARPRVEEILLGFGPGLRPLLRGLGQPALDPQARALGVDPLAELRPAPDQGLVGDLDRAVGRVGPLGRDQAGVAVGQGAGPAPGPPRPVAGRRAGARDTDTRRLVSSVPSPGCTSRRKIRRQRSWSSGVRLR